MSEGLSPDRIRELAALGAELPCRAKVVRSVADTSGYHADVELIDRRLESLNLTLSELPLDPRWLQPGGLGVFAPPAPGQIVWVEWIGHDAGHPVIAGFANPEPAKPRLPVAQGEHSIQGDTFDMRMLAGEWRVSDTAGTLISGTGRRWKIASPEDDLYLVLDALMAQFRSLMLSLINSHINPSTFAFDSTSLAGFNAILVLITEVERRLALVLRS